MRVRRLLLALIVLGLVLPLALPGARGAERFAFTPTEAEGGRLFYQEGIPIAVLSGTPEEMGRQQAALLGDAAQHVLTFPRRFIKEMGVDALWPLMVGAGRVLMHNAPVAHQHELAALSAAGKLDENALAVGNTLLELRRMGCSVLIVEPEHSATGGPLFGRNLDFPTLGELDQFSVLLVCRPTGRHAFASATLPAAIGVVSGMNDAGLAVATLDVYETADGSPMFNGLGTPLAFVFRRILEECTTVAEAETLLRSEKPTTWMNLAVCDRNGSAVFEITPKHIGRRDAEGGVLPCTNHFRTEGLATAAARDFCWRYPRLASAATEPPLSIDQVQKHLHAANQGEFTLQTMVFEPRELKLHIAFGAPPTSDDKLTAIDLAPLFGATGGGLPAHAAP